MDVVYLLGPGSLWHDRELFYSLRSVQRHLIGRNRVYVVGSPPRFAGPPGIPFKFLPFPDSTHCSQHNVRAKLQHILFLPNISDEFLLMNDDFYFLEDRRIDDIPLYRQGTLPMHIEWREHTGNPYVESLKKTASALASKGLPQVDFELHAPIRYQKDVLAAVLDDFNFDWSGHRGLLVRSLYGNYLRSHGVPLEDCKIDFPIERAEIDRRLRNRPYFSLGPGGCTPDMELKLHELFPPV